MNLFQSLLAAASRAFRARQAVANHTKHQAYGPRWSRRRRMAGPWR